MFGVLLFAELNKDQLSISASNIFLRGSLKALGWCCSALPAPQEMFARRSAAFVLSELVSLGNQLKAFQFGAPFLINSWSPFPSSLSQSSTFVSRLRSSRELSFECQQQIFMATK